MPRYSTAWSLDTNQKLSKGAADCAQLRQAARPIAKDLRRVPSYNVPRWCHATENTTMQQLQLGIFVAAMIAVVVCGCIFTRKPKKGH
jgi:hypothetical protein